MSRKVIFILSFLCLTVLGNAQDHLSWSSIQLNKKINDKWSVFLKPIVRHNISNTQYLNWSPDYAVNYTFSKNWRAMILGRTWIMPNRSNRQFIFFDIKHQHAFSNLTLRNTLRLHLAFDIDDIADGDFIRWHPSVSLKKIKKIEPYLGLQMFYQLNGRNQLDRIRYVLGASYTFNTKYKFVLHYWDEVFYNRDDPFRQNIWVINMVYNL